MQIFKEIVPLKTKLLELKLQGKKIGLVPTMGALHQGHVSLVEQALKEADYVISTVFVNPSQFNNAKDLENYPRDIQKDIAVLESKGCHALFNPSANTIYPDKPTVSICFGDIEKKMEGKFRPSHFQGVGLVVMKFLNIIQPDFVYFGQKDLQQFTVISKLCKDLFVPAKLRMMPTVRERSGLAMSSRNVQLSFSGKEKADNLYLTLQSTKQLINSGLALDTALSKGEDALCAIDGLKLDYFEAVNPETLNPLGALNEGDSIALCLACCVDGVRLIDNVIFKYQKE